MIFNVGSMPLDRSYYEHAERSVGGTLPPPVATVGEIGSSTFEMAGQQDLIAGAKAEIRKGVGKIELATAVGGPGSPVGSESYGSEAREALREIARANEISYTSVHVPTDVDGLSGYDKRSARFDDGLRKFATEEISKAVRFAAEATQGGAVNVHQGEFERPVSEEEWAWETLPDGRRRYKFLSNIEEPERTVLRVVDKKDGSLKSIAQKNRVLHRPIWKTAEDNYQVKNHLTGQIQNVRKGDYVDMYGYKATDVLHRVPIYDEKEGRFKTEAYTWDQVIREAKEYSMTNGEEIKPEVMYYRLNAENQIAQARGQAIYYSQRYNYHKRALEKMKEAYEFYKDYEEKIPPDKRKHLLIPEEYGRLVPPDEKLPSEYLRQQLQEVEQHLKHAHEAAANAEAQAAQMDNDVKNIVAIEDYALQQTRKTLAQAGVEAYEQTKNSPYVTQKDSKPVFISVENWNPSSWGSHPDEMLRLIKEGRSEMVKYLTEKTIDIDGKPTENPYYQGVGKSEAEKLASKHIRMTLDTEHLSLWRKKFTPKPGESRADTNSRFNEWYLQQIDKLAKADIISHVHLVDSIEGGHQHLPAGQGELPLNEVISRLKKAGFKGTIISEGHGENRKYGVDRQLTSAWRHLGNPVYGGRGIHPPPTTFAELHNYHLGRGQAPMFIYGAYTPSNEWTLWSQVPLE